ncbi:MAG: hypothetical protein ACYCQJ_04825 [Nitrososphaerales archaeon]
MSTESIPKWVAQEIQNAPFKEDEEWTGSGYILDINSKDRRIDVQFYEKLPEGRYIATLDVPKSVEIDKLELAVVYMFKFKAFKATLSDKVVNFLKEKYSLEMSNIYRFELESLERLEAERDTPPPSVESSDEEED